jgi:NitT/TauT family transport system substrate-binding protein
MGEPESVDDPVVLVDCCGTPPEERTFRPDVSPYAVHPDPRSRPVGRRSVLLSATAAGVSALLSACGKGGAPTVGAAASAGPSATAGTAANAVTESIDLPYCSQVLCGVPLEVGVKRGFFEAEGIKVNLVYMKGGALAMQALLGGSVDFVGTGLDVLVSAVAAGKQANMIASLSSLPFFALVTAPKSDITAISGLRGKTIGVANINTTDHLLARYLLEKNGISPDAVSFAPLGPNLFDGLRTGQVNAGLVQEPALTRLQDLGSTVLVNFMDRTQVDQLLGGPYQFFGLNTRPDVLTKRPETAAKLVRALTRTNDWIRANPGSAIVDNLPGQLLTDADREIFARRLDAVRTNLYPESLTIEKSSVQRVIDVQTSAGTLAKAVTADQVFTDAVVGALAASPAPS